MTSSARAGQEPQDHTGADADAERIFALEEENRQLKEAVTSHAVVDQAIGMVVGLARVTPDEAWRVLVEVSQHTNIKLRCLAETLVHWGGSGVLAPEIWAVLEETLDRRGPEKGARGTAQSFGGPGGGALRGREG
ncbi:hypothetical protein QFZ63_001114 [Streptomyces sp. B3I7]|uniref:ANTAR domain-containing protein n=1 Tax=Streptomyces sp. B3I7 TaxID=3042269 RepID=UPI00278A50F0|nr:ANTAR domain-containing protein [Streptomyces sp. B3I7]MDQ0809400.1 hypothetical protein [Streptomyces sp. B3I7]